GESLLIASPMRMISNRTADRVFRSASNESRVWPAAWSIRARAASRRITSVLRSGLIDQPRRAEDLFTPGGRRAVSNATPRRDPHLPVQAPRRVFSKKIKLGPQGAGVVFKKLD